MDLPLIFFPIFGQKNPLFLLKLSPSLFFWPKKSFFFKLVNFLPLYPIFPPIFGLKKSFFLLKLSRSLFFWPEKSFFSLKLVNFWTLFPNFFLQLLSQKIPFFVLKLSPSLFFFWPKKSFFCLFFLKLVNFCPYTQFFPKFWPKKSFFLLKLSPSLFFFGPKSLFFFKLFNFWTLFSN